MNVHAVRSADALLALRETWQAVLSRCTPSHIYMTWEWASVWWKHVGSTSSSRELFVLVVTDGGEPVAIMPFMLATVWHGEHQSTRDVHVLGYRVEQRWNDWMDVPAIAGKKAAAIEAALEFLEEHRQLWDRVDLWDLPDDSETIDVLARSAAPRLSFQRHRNTVCPYVPTRGDWNAYLRTHVQTRVRQKVESAAIRQLFEAGDLVLHWREPQRYAADLEAVFTLNRARQAARNQRAVFADAAQRDFFRDLTATLPPDAMHLPVLEHRGQVIAAELGFRHGAKIYGQFFVFHPEFHALSPGHVLRRRVLEQCFADPGIAEYDFLRGDEHYKEHWATAARHGVRVTLGKLSKKASQRRAPAVAADEYRSGRARSGRLIATPNPVPVDGPSRVGTTTLSWTSQGAQAVEVRVGAPDGELFSRTESAGSAATGNWVHEGMTFYLQDVSDGLPLTAAHTLATLTVQVAPIGESAWSRGLITRAVRAFTRRAAILMYHRINELPADLRSICVTPGHFAEHLEVLRAYDRPLDVRTLAEGLHDGRLPRRAIVITFDDGYADNFEQARPLLARHDMPATMFVTSGFVGENREFWWDELERLLLLPGTVPERFTVTVGGEEFEWRLGDAARYSDESYEHDRSWRPWDPDTPTTRHMMYRALEALMRQLGNDERDAVLDALRAWASADGGVRATHRVLTAGELVGCARDNLIEVGAHTVSHPRLSSLPAADQAREIRESKASLERVLDAPVRSFAYPFGAYTAETPGLVREAGFTSACAASAGIVRLPANVYELDRVAVGDWDGEEFARRLHGWLNV